VTWNPSGFETIFFTPAAADSVASLTSPWPARRLPSEGQGSLLQCAAFHAGGSLDFPQERRKSSPT